MKCDTEVLMMGAADADETLLQFPWFLSESSDCLSHGSKYGVICSITSDFRSLAAKLVSIGDVVVEIGSSYGRCTQILATACCNPAAVLGLETSKEAIIAARACYPTLNFQRANVLREPGRALQLVQQLVGAKRRAAATGKDCDANFGANTGRSVNCC